MFRSCNFTFMKCWIVSPEEHPTLGANGVKSMKITLWTAQILLALAFALAGASKLLTDPSALATSMPWVADAPAWLPRAIGLAELAGAVGLVVPAATGIRPALTTWAAAGRHARDPRGVRGPAHQRGAARPRRSRRLGPDSVRTRPLAATPARRIRGLIGFGADIVAAVGRPIARGRPGAVRTPVHTIRHDEVAAAQIVVAAAPFDATLEFFVERLGFALEEIFPAEAPRIAVVVGYGVRLRLDAGARGPAPPIHLVLAAASEPRPPVRAPNGALVTFAPDTAAPPPAPWRPAPVLVRAREGTWTRGRAGMAYRDLVPDRQGGAVVASQIRIEVAGPVSDTVHFHVVHAQLIYCHHGWVRVVYEDQGPPFVLEAGDAVLQPPRIRHRVLESSGDLDVIEVTCPAEHSTRTDRTLALPTAREDPARDFAGQRFVRHRACDATWAHPSPNVTRRDLGVAAATGGRADAGVVRVAANAEFGVDAGSSLCLAVVLAGDAELHDIGAATLPITAMDSFIPAPASRARLRTRTDVDLLVVTLAADLFAAD
jgi:quercetin dioxygenase-like cupin family protein